ncbi:MAG: glycosyltransferase family 4 protein [Syntrophomonadaceae bacterium]|jgi:hypothetical protein|nr:glycosyltransferase family 4 protein [Syntrophomonadaceae bacterium]
MPNLLILSYFFPPSNDIAARRFGTMAGWLESLGFNVYILTTFSQGSLPQDIDEDKVVRVGNNRQKSACVDDLADEKLPPFIDRVRKPLRQKGFYLWSVDRTLVTWYREITANISFIDSRIEKPDLIIGSFGPSACLWGARFLAKYYGVPWIADIRDLGAQRADDRHKIARYIDIVIEKRLLYSAVGITTVSNTLKKILVRCYPLPVQLIYNGWNHALNNIPADTDTFDRAKYIYYAGSFHPEQIPSLLLLLESLTDFPDLSLVIRSLGPHELNLEVMECARELGLDDRVFLLPPCSHEIVSREARQSRINLVLNDLSADTEWTRGTVTGKLFELLHYKAPILAVGRFDGEMGDILRQTHKGTLCSTRRDINSFLAAVAKDPSVYSGISLEIREFSREQQAKQLVSFIRRFIPFSVRLRGIDREAI